MNPTLQWALRYLKRGWSIIPVSPRSKTPAVSWQEFQTRKATVEEVKEWFSTPGMNIGVVTGAISGLVVVDIDGPEGEQSAKGLGLSSTVSASTGKGRHLLFNHPGFPVKNFVARLPGLDLRGDGGYFAVAPSVHPSGRLYRWITSPELPLPSFPASVLEVKQEDARNEPGWVAGALGDMKVGNIDNTLFKICAKLRNDGYSKAEALLFLKSHAESAGATPDHLPSKIDHVWATYEPKVKESIESQVLSDFLDKEESVSWIVPGLIASNSIGFIAGLPETCKTWVTMDLAIEAARGGKWLGLFDVNPSKVLFIDQERFAGETRRRFKALFSGKSLNYRELNGRLSVQVGSTVKLDLDASYQALQRTMNEMRPDLVIVDSFATFHTKDENDRTSIQTVLERVKALRQDYGCTILFIDHENKGAYHDAKEGDARPTVGRMSGSVAKPAASEFVMTVKSQGSGSSSLHVTKSTLAPAPDPVFVEVKDITPDRSQIRVEGKKLT